MDHYTSTFVGLSSAARAMAIAGGQLTKKPDTGNSGIGLSLL